MGDKIYGLRKENKRLARTAVELGKKLDGLRKEMERQKEEKEEVAVLVESNRILTGNITSTQERINDVMAEME